MATVDIFSAMLGSDDPVLRFLANGGAWGDAQLMEDELQREREAEQEADRLARAVESIPKWEGQLEAVLRKHMTPSAEKHKARLVQSLREAYAAAGRDPSSVDAFLAAAEAAGQEEVQAKAKAKAKAAAKPKGKGAFAALADSDEE
jgi:Asp-tRNA(Asn)/Glu-tRNA(Gln) amidotransferase C subunit